MPRRLPGPVVRIPCGVFGFGLLLVLSLIGCAGEKPPAPASASRPAPAPAAQVQPPSPLTPYLAETVGDWRRHGDPRTWSAATLDTYIGPDADRWRACDLLDTVVGSYDRGADATAIVELYRFRTSPDAFAAYSTRRGMRSRLVAVGNEGFATTHSLLAWKAATVVRVIGRAPDADGLVPLARAIADSLPAGTSKPAALDFLRGLPVAPGSEIWTREDALGYSIFRNSALALLQAGETDVVVLRHPAQTGADALSRFEDFRASVTLSAKSLDPVLGIGNESFLAQDAQLGNTLAFRIGSDVVVLRGQVPPDALVALAGTISAKLRVAQTAPAAETPAVTPP